MGDEVLAFWLREAGLKPAAARERVDRVVCVLRRAGDVVGTSEVQAAEIASLGSRRLWVMSAALAAAAVEELPGLVRATFRALDVRSDGAPGSPIGLLLAVADPRVLAARPQAEWADPRMIYAGYLPDGRQIRVAYFHTEGPAFPYPLRAEGTRDRTHRIEIFCDQEAVTPADVVALWTREGALPADEAERRAGEIVCVATAGDGSLAAVATSYLQHSAQLKGDFWNFRTFVASEHRRSSLAIALALATRDELIRRHGPGGDRRGLGIIIEAENPILERAYPFAHWWWVDFLLAYERPDGVAVRLHFFPGALAPAPPERRSAQGST